MSAEPGEWQLTPSCPAAGGVLKHWQFVTPFGIDSASQFRSPPPPALDSRIYARNINEVAEVGAIDSSARPQRKTDAARFYNVVLAVATWNPVARQAALAHALPLAQQARLFALLNMAISDGLVAVMDTKYEHRLWRPETAIHQADADGNPRTQAQPAFQPLIAARCFPSYGSARAAASYAARRVAEAFFGEDEQRIVLTHPAVPGVVLEYGSFEDHAGHRRCPCLWRHPLPLRPACRRTDGAGRRAVGGPSPPAAGAGRAPGMTKVPGILQERYGSTMKPRPGVGSTTGLTAGTPLAR